MSTPESPFNPSRQVERIREILVGRHLAAVEQRLDRLELRGESANGQGQGPYGGPLAAEEARPGGVERLEQRLELEAEERRQAAAALAARIHESLDQLARRVDACPSAVEFDERLGSLREEFRQEQTRLQGEIRQETRVRMEVVSELAGRISALAAGRGVGDREAQEAAVQRLRASLEDWQRRLIDYLQQREQWLIDQLRTELEHLRDDTWHWLGELHRTKVDRHEFESRLPRGGAVLSPPSPWQRSPG